MCYLLRDFFGLYFAAVSVPQEHVSSVKGFVLVSKNDN